MKVSLLICAVLPLLVSCNSKKDPALFAIRHGADLGIDFQNTLVTNDTFNAVTFEYIYNGSGVGVGDFNNDGLQDLFFGGNQVSSRLYLNEGNLKFREVTRQAGVSTDRWVTGVSVVDINGDGFQDIFLCVAGKTQDENRRDLLFINEGVRGGLPVFEESSKSYGLDDDRYSTMAAFFDYDKDGDLDLYIVNNWLEKFNRNNLRPKRMNGEAESTDRLYRNNGNNTFTNVSREAGILIEGYGLGVVICDLNQDSWPDVYVSNDFMSNDLIWINQQDGTFRNLAGDYLKHQTHNGMGVDIADFNNDAMPDILEVDMLPPDHKRQKLMTPGQNYDHFYMSLQLGYQPQYMRNTLQLNRGRMPDGRLTFSEIAFLAGVAQTDWSWAPLFADFDNDGWKDIFIGNGYRKDVTNLDFIFFSMEGSPFGTPEARREKYLEELEKLEPVQTSNHVYRNTGSLVFEDKTVDWGIQLPTYSNGAAYADFDNDGDLDLVTNNIDQEVVFYENTLNTRKDRNHFIRLIPDDRSAFNEKIRVYTEGKCQYQDRTPFRGFQSTVASDAHFGVGQSTRIDSVVVEWQDHSVAKYVSIRVDTMLKFSKADSRKVSPNAPMSGGSVFQKVEPVAFRHHETSLPDLKVTRTLLHDLTRFGPCLAAGDINGDRLDDFFIGGETGNASRIFIQQFDGTFRSTRFTTDSTREDGAALFLDADLDGDLDLYVAGACPSAREPASRHHLFLNDGQGNFSQSNGLPEISNSASCVESADYDADGDLDLFVGGRLKPDSYPYPPRSYVLRNDRGKFTDVTTQLNVALEAPGLVSSAVWADVDHDGKPDLAIAGEWMPIRVFRNEGDKFSEITNQVGLGNSNGWWNCLRAADLNRDGYVEIIAGNTGKNSYFQPTLREPVQIIAKDFDKNGSMDPVITYYNPVEKARFIVHNRLVLLDQIPSLKKRFETFTQYATTPFEKAFRKEELEGAFVGNAYELASVILINKAGKKFERVELPEITQVSTINDVMVDDVNQDGFLDILVIGNTYCQETLFGRYDASLGTILLGDGNLTWKEWLPSSTGFVIDGDSRHIAALKSSGDKLYVVASNDDWITFFGRRKQGLGSGAKE